MADNVAITPGTGATVAADDIGGVLHQRVKLSIGADGSAADLSFGSASDSASLPMAFSTEGKAQLGSVTEAAPASDTASSGLNGRMQRVAQRITSLIALLPTSLGSKADSGSLAVTQSTEDKALLGVKVTSVTALETGGTGIIGWLSQAWRELSAIKTAVESTAPVEVYGSGNTLAGSTATCDTVADQIVAGAAGRKMVHVFANTDNAVAIYLGPSSVTASNGIPLYPGDEVIWPLGDDPLYGITASGSATVRYATII